MSDNFDKAVNFAIEQLKVIKAGNLQNKSEALAKYFQYGKPSEMDWALVVKEAERDPKAFEFLELHSSRTLKSNEAFNPEVKEWLCSYLEGEIKKPKRSIGAPRKKSGRNFFIFSLISIIRQKFKLPISRNEESSKKESACDAVSQAIIEVNNVVKDGALISPTSFNELRQLYSREKK